MGVKVPNRGSGSSYRRSEGNSGLWDRAWEWLVAEVDEWSSIRAEQVEQALQSCVRDMRTGAEMAFEEWQESSEEEYRRQLGVNDDWTRQVLEGYVAMVFPPTMIVQFDDPNARLEEAMVSIDDPGIDNELARNGRFPQFYQRVAVEVDYIPDVKWCEEGYQEYTIRKIMCV